MDLEHQTPSQRRRANVNIALLSNTDLVSDRIDCPGFHVRVQCKVVQSAVCESVSIVLCIFYFCDEVDFCEDTDGFIDAVAGADRGDLGY